MENVDGNNDGPNKSARRNPSLVLGTANEKPSIVLSTIMEMRAEVTKIQSGADSKIVAPLSVRSDLQVPETMADEKQR